MSDICSNNRDLLPFDPCFVGLRQNSEAATLCRPQQSSSHHVDIYQATSNEQPGRIFVQPPVTYFIESEDPFENQKWMLDLRPDFGFGSILTSIDIGQGAVSVTFLVGEIFGPGRVFDDLVPFSGIRRIAPNACLIAVEQITEYLAIVYVSCCGDHGVDQFGLAVDTNVPFHTKVPFGCPSWFGASPGRACPLCSWSSSAHQ